MPTGRSTLRTRAPVAASQSRSVPVLAAVGLAAVAIVLPSGEKAIPLTLSPFAASVWSSAPDATSQSRAVPSGAAVRTRRGPANCHLRTCVWPASTSDAFPSARGAPSSARRDSRAPGPVALPATVLPRRRRVLRAVAARRRASAFPSCRKAPARLREEPAHLGPHLRSFCIQAS
jgi:hypothetical protein